MAIQIVNIDGVTYPIYDNRISSLPISVAQGGTGATTAAGAVQNLLGTVSSSAGKYLRDDGTWQTVSTSDTKVNQTAVTTSGGYPILFSEKSATREQWASQSYDGANEAYVDPAVAVNPNQSRIVVRASAYSTSFGSGSGYDLYDVDNSKFTGTFQSVAQGTASAEGNVALSLGNSTGSGTAGNASGSIYLYGAATVPTLLRSKASDQAKTNYLPNVTGELVVHSNNSATGSSTNPVYIANTGAATATAVGTAGAWTSFVPYASSTGIMEIGRCVDFHQPLSTIDYDYRILVNAATTTAYDSSANLRIYKPSSVTGGLQVEMPLIGKSGGVTVGNYTTTAASSLPAGVTGQIMFVLD